MNSEVSRPAVESKTFVEVLRKRALSRPDGHAYTFLRDGEAEELCVTYAELDRRARAVAALLQSCGTPGERALLLYPPGLEFIAAFFGCLYAGFVGIPAPLPRLGRSDRVLSRLRAIASDAEPVVTLTTSRVLAEQKELLAGFPELARRTHLTTDNMASHLMEEWWEPAIDGSTLAYLQYTSGSTAAPKGVMVTHDNLLHNVRMIQTSFAQSEQSVMIGWLPQYHDMGLVGNILQPLYTGSRCVLMSPLAFLQRPVGWLRAISRYRGTISGGPNFAYDLCARTLSSRPLDLDLSSWRVAFNGSEPIRRQTLAEFSAAFARYGFDPDAFHPCYGLAEATLLVTGECQRVMSRALSIVKSAALQRKEVVEASSAGEESMEVVSCGPPAPGQKVVIADPVTGTRCPTGRIGEIWLSGANVTRGYWKQPEETSRVFRARLAHSDEGPFLRTGDLGFLHDGELFVTGRLKDLIIIRGQNYYPQDVEWAVQESHPAIRPWSCAAFSVGVDGEERLVVVAEVHRQSWPGRRGEDGARVPVDVDAVEGALRQAVSEQFGLHLHAVQLIQAGTIPKTSSGKIQRHACRAGFESGSLSVVGNVADEQEIYRQ